MISAALKTPRRKLRQTDKPQVAATQQKKKLLFYFLLPVLFVLSLIGAFLIQFLSLK